MMDTRRCVWGWRGCVHGGVPRFEGHVHSAASPSPPPPVTVVDSVGGCARSGPRRGSSLGWRTWLAEGRRGGEGGGRADAQLSPRSMQRSPPPSSKTLPTLPSPTLPPTSLGQRPPRANAPTTPVLSLSLCRTEPSSPRFAVCLHRCRTFNRDRSSHRPVPLDDSMTGSNPGGGIEDDYDHDDDEGVVVR